MTLRHSIEALLIVLLASCSGRAADPKEFVEVSSTLLPGRLYVPPEAQDSKRPLIVFLHGAGESGTNNTSQINSNVDNLFAAAKQRGAFLYAPQATTVLGQIYNWNDAARTTRVMEKLDEILAGYNVDPQRVYLTGLSMGGGGTWTIANRYPGRFAAALPIAGVKVRRDFSPAVELKTPVWAFHARNDSVISKNESRSVVNAMLAAAGKDTLTFPPANDRTTTVEFVDEALDLRYTEFPTGDHGIWGKVYNRSDVYDWMFTHSVPEPNSAVLLASGLLSWHVVRRRR